MRKLLLCILLSLELGTASAASITGDLWTVPDSVSRNAVPANVPATPPDVTFQVNSPLNFTDPSSVDAWLLSGGAFNILGLPAMLSRPMSNGITSTLVEFTGLVTVTNGQQFTVTHDDGLTLIIGGVSTINVPGPTPPLQTVATYTGPSGNLPFTLVYGECCDGAAVLQVDLPFQPGPPPTNTPEPITIVMTAGGLAMAGIARRWRRGRSDEEQRAFFGAPSAPIAKI